MAEEAYDILLDDLAAREDVRFMHEWGSTQYLVDGHTVPFRKTVQEQEEFRWMCGYIVGWAEYKRNERINNLVPQTHSRDRFSLLNSLLDQGMGFDVENVPTAMNNKEYANMLEKLIEDWCLPQGFKRDVDDELHYVFDDEKNAAAYDAQFIPEGDGFGHWHVKAKIASTKGTVVTVEATDYGFEDAYEAVRQATMAVS